MTAGNTAGKTGLVRITAPFSGLGGFLYDGLGMLMVLRGIGGKSRTFSAHHGYRSAPLSDPFRPIRFDAEGHVLEVVIVAKDTLEIIDDDIDGSV